MRKQSKVLILLSNLNYYVRFREHEDQVARLHYKVTKVLFQPPLTLSNYSKDTWVTDKDELLQELISFHSETQTQ